jgi:indole-3-glycerol phosphate synthase
MSATYLDSILEFHRARVAADTRDWRSRTPSPAGPSLRDALLAHRATGLAVIAEVKRRSPSQGWLAEGLDAPLTAQHYVAGGASAVSVLTDGPHFGGSLRDLAVVSSSVSVPTLRKDFLLSENDIYDSLTAGAGAVLLIAAALDAAELASLVGCARDAGCDSLVEVHDVGEAKRALDVGSTLVGVNQRNLHTFEVDARRAEEVVHALPSSVVAVAESGFHNVESVAQAAASGFDAVLVGEHLVRQSDPARAVRALVGHPIGGR